MENIVSTSDSFNPSMQATVSADSVLRAILRGLQLFHDKRDAFFVLIIVKNTRKPPCVDPSELLLNKASVKQTILHKWDPPRSGNNKGLLVTNCSLRTSLLIIRRPFTVNCEIIPTACATNNARSERD